MKLYVKINEARGNFEDYQEIESDELHDLLTELRHKRDCASFIVNYDYMFDEEYDKVLINIYNGYME